jgi:hypothetical protein
MFKLRPEHHAALHEVALENFEQRGLADLREQFPDKAAGLSGDPGHTFFRQTVTRAEGMGLTSEQAIMAYAVIRMTLPPGFEKSPEWDWVPEMLGDTVYDQNTRAWRAVEHVHEALEP